MWLLREERSLRSSHFTLIFLKKDLKVSRPEKSGRIVANKKTCIFLTEITKQGAQSMGTKRRNAELYSKVAAVIYGLQLLAAPCSKIARTSAKVGKACSHWLYSKYRREYRSKLQPITCRVCVEKEIVEVYFAEMTKDR